MLRQCETLRLKRRGEDLAAGLSRLLAAVEAADPQVLCARVMNANLPVIPAVTASPHPERKACQPEHAKYHCRNPQEMDSERQAEENNCQKQEQDHQSHFSYSFRRGAR